MYYFYSVALKQAFPMVLTSSSWNKGQHCIIYHWPPKRMIYTCVFLRERKGVLSLCTMKISFSTTTNCNKATKEYVVGFSGASWFSGQLSSLGEESSGKPLLTECKNTLGINYLFKCVQCLFWVWFTCPIIDYKSCMFSFQGASDWKPFHAGWNYLHEHELHAVHVLSSVMKIQIVWLNAHTGHKIMSKFIFHRPKDLPVQRLAEGRPIHEPTDVFVSGSWFVGGAHHCLATCLQYSSLRLVPALGQGDKQEKETCKNIGGRERKRETSSNKGAAFWHVLLFWQSSSSLICIPNIIFAMRDMTIARKKGGNL